MLEGGSEMNGMDINAYIPPSVMAQYVLLTNGTHAMLPV